jgi:Fe-S-cluster containining protein
VRKAASIALPVRRLGVVRYDEGVEGPVISTAGGSCVFLDDEVRCRIHATVGPEYKPAPCRRFPLGATETPRGVRVTLSHRCPCNSVGISPALEAGLAEQVLASPRTGKVVTDYDVGARVRWRERTSVRFEDYEVWERSMLASLDRDDDPEIEQVLGMAEGDRLPELKSASWEQVANQMQRWAKDEDQHDGFSCVLRWAEGALRYGRGWLGPFPPRPWQWTFDRAHARSPLTTPARRVYGSWLADDLWSMTWAYRSSLYRQMADLTARYVIASRIGAVLEAQGVRTDLASAEGVMVADTLGASDTWSWARGRLLEAEAGAY